ncbi:MAG: hypothetical protein QGH40_11970 [bacterium]|jgi:hypothetical protein|nr:hypothetical protein [bacterium]
MTTVEPELFLDDVGKLVASREGKNIWEVRNLSAHPLFKDRNMPDLIYVVDFPGRGVGQEFLLSRHVAGPQKFLMIREISHTMVRLFVNEFTGRVAQFVVLWGGRPLDLLDADPPIYSGGLVDTTYLKLTRVEDKSAARGWKVVQSSMVGQWWEDDTWLLQDECIASGETVRYCVEEGFKHHRPKKLFMFPVCASAVGIEGVNEACQKHGVKFIPVLNEAIMQVAEKGISLPYTDLGLHPKTIVTREFYQALKRRYQGTSICWLGDVGDSMYKTTDYLIETFHDMVTVGMNIERENFDDWLPLIRTDKFLNELVHRVPGIFNKVAPLIKGKRARKE